MASETPEPSGDDLTGRRRSTYTPPAGGIPEQFGETLGQQAPEASAPAQTGWGQAEQAQYQQWEEQMFAIGTPEAIAEVQRVRVAYAPYLNPAPQQAPQQVSQEQYSQPAVQYQPQQPYARPEQQAAQQQPEGAQIPPQQQVQQYSSEQQSYPAGQHYPEQASPLPQYTQVPQQPPSSYPDPGYLQPGTAQPGFSPPEHPQHATPEPAAQEQYSQPGPPAQGGHPQQDSAGLQPEQWQTVQPQPPLTPLSPETAARLTQPQDAQGPASHTADAQPTSAQPQDEFVQPVSGYPDWSAQPQSGAASPQQPVPPRRPEPPQVPGSPNPYAGTAAYSGATGSVQPLAPVAAQFTGPVAPEPLPTQVPPGQPSWATGSRQQPQSEPQPQPEPYQPERFEEAQQQPYQASSAGPQHSNSPAPQLSPSQPDSEQNPPGAPAVAAESFAPPIFIPPTPSTQPSYSVGSYPAPSPQQAPATQAAQPESPFARQSPEAAPSAGVAPSPVGYGDTGYPVAAEEMPTAEPAQTSPEPGAHQTSAPNPAAAEPVAAEPIAQEQLAQEQLAQEPSASVAPPVLPRLADPEPSSSRPEAPSYTPGLAAEFDSTLERLRDFSGDAGAEPLPEPERSELAAPMLSVDEIPSFWPAQQEAMTSAGEPSAAVSDPSDPVQQPTHAEQPGAVPEATSAPEATPASEPAQFPEPAQFLEPAQFPEPAQFLEPAQFPEPAQAPGPAPSSDPLRLPEPPGLVEPPDFGDAGDYRDSLNLIDSGAIYIQQPIEQPVSETASSATAVPEEAAVAEPAASLAPASFEEVLSGTAPVLESSATDFWGSASPQSAPDAPVADAPAPEAADAVPPAATPAGMRSAPAGAEQELDPLSGMLVIGAEQDAPPGTNPPRAGTIESIGIEPTPLEQRLGSASRLFWVWFALNSSLLSLTVGAALLVSGLSLRQALIATLSGVALSALPLALGTIAGKWSGQPTMVVSRATFGLIGNALPALVAIISRLFGAAVLLWLLAASTAQLLVLAGLDTVLDGSLLTLIAVGVAVLLAAVFAGVGYHLILRLHIFVSALSLVLIAGFITITWGYVDLSTALARADGDWWLVISGTVLVFAVVGLAYANSTSDVARYQRPSSSGGGAASWATIGAVLPALLLIGYGALLAASNEQIAAGFMIDPVRTLAALLPVWYPVPLLLGIGLSMLAGLVTAVYSAGLAAQALGLRGSRQLPAILAVIIVAAAVLGVNLLEIDFAPMLLEHAILVAIPVAAWAGIFVGDLMIRTRRFDQRGLLIPGGSYPQWRWGNLIMFLVLIALGYGLNAASLPWLEWQGYLVPLLEPLGLVAEHPLITGGAVVLGVLLLGWLIAVTTGIPAVRKQERGRRMVVDAGEEL